MPIINCCVSGCPRIAYAMPELHVWPDGLPKEEGQQIRAEIKLPHCQKHMLETKVEQIISEDGWEAIKRSAAAVDLLPTREGIELRWHGISLDA